MTMFRDLLELEREALREQAERAGSTAPVVAAFHMSSTRERVSQTLPACPGIWALRSPI